MKKILYILFIIALLLWIYRFFPYFFVNIPFWYDPWLYRHLFLDYFNSLPFIDFSSFSQRTQQAYPPFLWFFSSILQLIWFSPDFLLSFWLWIFSVLTSFFIYLVLKKYSNYTAFFWAIIFLISIIQYQAFWFNYYKQIIWIIFMLTAIYLLNKKQNILLIPVIIALFTIHRPTWLYFLLTFIFYKLIRYFIFKEKCLKDVYSVLLAWILSLIIYFPVFKQQILSLLNPLFTTIGDTWRSWTFFLRSEFAIYNFFILIASFYGLYLKIRKKDFDYISAWYIVWVIWIWFWMFFYNRMYIFFDIFIILMAWYAFWELYQKYWKKWLYLFMLFFITQGIYYLNYLQHHNKPLIPQIELEKIKKIYKTIDKNAMIMVTHKNYSPWLFGYTSKPIIAPGLFEWNKWGLDSWKKWWYGDGKVKCKMIQDYEKIYHRPLYLWIWKYQPKSNLSWADCFTPVFVWKHYIFLKVNVNNNEK